jgi:hypothetical protein
MRVRGKKMKDQNINLTLSLLDQWDQSSLQLDQLGIFQPEESLFTKLQALEIVPHRHNYLRKGLE